MNDDVWIEPLTSKMPDGTPCHRQQFVEAAIAKGLRMLQAERLANLPQWPSETIAYFVVHTARSDEDAFAEMLQELVKRGSRIARRDLRGMDRAAASGIVEDVEGRLLELLLSKEPSLKREFLEMSFKNAVELYTLNRIRDYLRSPLGGRRMPLKQTDEDGDAIEEPLELLPSGLPGPHDSLLCLRDTNERHRLLRIACQAVDDRVVLKALILHYGYGWPVNSTDKRIPCVCRHFGMPERTMYRMLGAGISAMRKALNVELPTRKGDGK